MPIWYNRKLQFHCAEDAEDMPDYGRNNTCGVEINHLTITPHPLLQFLQFLEIVFSRGWLIDLGIGVRLRCVLTHSWGNCCQRQISSICVTGFDPGKYKFVPLPFLPFLPFSPFALLPFCPFALLPFCPFCPFCPFALLTFCSFCPYAILSFTF